MKNDNDFIMKYIKAGNKEKNIIFLHGNGEDCHIFSNIVDMLKNEYTCYSLTTRNCSKKYLNKTISYEDLADDVYLFILKNNIKNLVIYGFSDGGIIGLILAIKYPNLIDKLIISGVNFNPKGLKFQYRVFYRLMCYLTNSNLYRLMIKGPNIKIEEIRRIKTRVNILVGKKDVINKKHTLKLKNNLRNCTLEIINSNHYKYVLDNFKLYKTLRKYL